MTHAQANTKILLSVFCTALAYFAVGLPLAVLPSWVSGDLGFGATVAGLVISVQYVATIVSRGMVGPMIDTSGPRRAILIGFGFIAASGLIMLAAVQLEDRSVLALAVLLVSRIVLGLGESLVGTSSIAWGIARSGTAHTATVISWNGIAIYAAIAAGAPAGVLLVHVGGLEAASLALLAVGLVGLLFVWPQPATEISTAPRLAYATVFAKVLPYGAVLGLGSIGFGVITTFAALYFAARGWDGAWIAISAFGLAFVVGRLLFVGKIARYGGLAIALVFLSIEAVGVLTMALSNVSSLVIVGAGLAGLGFSLVFPALGMIVVGLVPEQSRGAAIGAYSVFTDISLCVTGPVAGVLATGLGDRAPFLFGASCAMVGIAVVSFLIRERTALMTSA